MARLRPLRPALGRGPITLVALTLFLTAPQPVGAAITWVARGAFADREFTSIVSPPGYPCVVAFTALGNGGLGLSTDCGVNFGPILTTNAYAVIAKSTDVGWVAAGSSGMVKTVNGGASWFAINNGLSPLRDARAITVHLAGPDTIYGGFHGDGVYVGRPAADSTVSWTAMNNGLGDLNVRDLARVRGGTYFLAATDGGIWRWTNGSWSLSAGGLVANTLIIDSADSARCYAAGPGGVFKSLDAGQSFQPSSNGLPAGKAVNDIARRTDDPSILYVGTAGAGVYESLDYGASWHPFGPPVPGDNDVRSVAAIVQQSLSQANIFAGTLKDGLFEAQYSTPVEPVTWGKLKATYR